MYTNCLSMRFIRLSVSTSKAFKNKYLKINAFTDFKILDTHNLTVPFVLPCTVSTRPVGQNAESYMLGIQLYILIRNRSVFLCCKYKILILIPWAVNIVENVVFLEVIFWFYNQGYLLKCKYQHLLLQYNWTLNID